MSTPPLPSKINTKVKVELPTDLAVGMFRTDGLTYSFHGTTWQNWTSDTRIMLANYVHIQQMSSEIQILRQEVNTLKSEMSKTLDELKKMILYLPGKGPEYKKTEVHFHQITEGDGK